jgi:hypothetical protein
LTIVDFKKADICPSPGCRFNICDIANIDNDFQRRTRNLWDFLFVCLFVLILGNLDAMS